MAAGSHSVTEDLVGTVLLAHGWQICQSGQRWQQTDAAIDTLHWCTPSAAGPQTGITCCLGLSKHGRWAGFSSVHPNSGHTCTGRHARLFVEVDAINSLVLPVLSQLFI